MPGRAPEEASRPADKKTDVEAAPEEDAPRGKGGRWGASLHPLLPSGSALTLALARGAPPRAPPAVRPAVALALLALLLLALHRFGPGLAAHAEPAALRATFEAAGDVGGVVLYVVAFSVGELLHLPGMLFVAAGVLVWGCVRRRSAAQRARQGARVGSLRAARCRAHAAAQPRCGAAARGWRCAPAARAG